jgi:hypothetical protein
MERAPPFRSREENAYNVPPPASPAGRLFTVVQTNLLEGYLI